MAQREKTERNAYIIERRSQGATLREIAEETGISFGWVRSILEREKWRTAETRDDGGEKAPRPY
ncbi:MAG TPA: hypothetical protein VGR27_00680 [Longimicrobiaceae bacterium]|nr:hypothetical protein [Longimicrobiaceae bacterium]